MNLVKGDFGCKRSGMSGLFDEYILDPLKEKAQTYEQEISSWAKDTLPDNIYDKVSQLPKQQAEKFKELAMEKGTAAAMKYLADQQVEKKAVSAGIQAGAQWVDQSAQDFIDAYKKGQIFKKYKTPIMIAGGLMGLLVLKFIIGRKRVKVVKVKD